MAYGIGRQGGLVHIVHEVRPPAGDRPALTTWKCNRTHGSYGAIHLDEIGDRVPCLRCTACADDTDERFVYVARVGDLVKVGCSNQVGRRLDTLGGALIARTPGGFAAERRVLDLINTPPARGREWFPASAEAEAVAALRSAV